MKQPELPGTRHPLVDFHDDTADESHPAVVAYQRAADEYEVGRRARIREALKVRRVQL